MADTQNNDKTLVVGAGLAGVRCALDLAETGRPVTLIDADDHPGGILALLDRQFPTNHCGMCRLLPLFERDAADQRCLRKGVFHENIEFWSAATLEGLEGDVGRFTATIKRRPRPVDPDKCTACGVCVDACPVEVEDPFNAGMSKRKAIGPPTPHMADRPYVIDPAACTRCGECVRVCPTGAVDLSDAGRSEFSILVVDDERIMRDSLKAWLEDGDYTVQTAGGGREALDMLAGEAFDLMLLDIKMPGMDGVEVLEKARRDHPDLTVIMMTAYATVDTAVEAMKTGAMDYLVKPFDMEALLPKVEAVFDRVKKPGRLEIDVGAVVLACGVDFHDPASGMNVLGYGQHPNVVTSIEFERLLNPLGPTRGRLERPSDGAAIQRAAWVQCVGARDQRFDADYCAGACCMYSLKEAVMFLEQAGPEAEAVVFYMDMRTAGKSYQRYRDQAQAAGVKLIRCRPHTLHPDLETGGVKAAYVEDGGQARVKSFDLVVLAAAARPSAATGELAEKLGLSRNEWGFCQTAPLRPMRTEREGVFVCGSFAEPADIRDSVIGAHAAAAAAAGVLGGLYREAASPAFRDVGREAPSTLIAVCQCPAHEPVPEELAGRLSRDPAVDGVMVVDNFCSQDGWERLVKEASPGGFNRVLVGACPPRIQRRKAEAAARELNLSPELVRTVDIFTEPGRVENQKQRLALMESALRAGLAKLRRAPARLESVAVTEAALVVGGGPAGMSAALTLADQGVSVHLVEKTDALGGRLPLLPADASGADPQALLAELTARVDRHPRITVHYQSQVQSASGSLGDYRTRIRDEAGRETELRHGAVILAVGGSEAAPESFGPDRPEAVVTQDELRRALADGRIKAGDLNHVVMIQCVDSRMEPRNFCSRVCCPTALQLSDALLKANPEVHIWVLYRDVMTPGFQERLFSDARRAGVRFIRYDTDDPPRVAPVDQGVRVTAVDPILGAPVSATADLVVLAAGVRPELPGDLAAGYGAGLDQDGFFREADPKWRPLDGLQDGVFACGLALAPTDVKGAVAGGAAAASRALRILCRREIKPSAVSASVRQALCSLCLTCINACPHEARWLDEEDQRLVVNPALCQGCGACASACPNGAAILAGFDDRLMFETIDAALSAGLAGNKRSP